MRYIYGLLLVSLLFATAACHKDKPKPTTAELLTKSPWILKGDLFDLERDGSFVNDLQDCERGDTYVFLPDSLYEFHDSPEICNPGGPTLDKNGTWVLWQHDSVLYIQLPLWAYQFHNIKISEDSLEIRAYDPNKPTQKDIRILTFTH